MSCYINYPHIYPKTSDYIHVTLKLIVPKEKKVINPDGKDKLHFTLQNQGEHVILNFETMGTVSSSSTKKLIRTGRTGLNAPSNITSSTTVNLWKGTLSEHKLGGTVNKTQADYQEDPLTVK